MATAYSALGAAVIVINLATAALGTRDRHTDRPSIAFWYLLRGAQATTMLFVLFACLIYLLGHRASDQLHYLYVLLPVVVSFMAELFRGSAANQELGDRLDPSPGDSPLDTADLAARFAELDPEEQERIGLAIVRRETLIMTIACLVNAFLIWRALATTSGLF
ncbi:MAG: hypothetical protein M9938_11395 [Solirubrobacterales bacterium]|nr:hypothetical protein [Solirubrobacterales bacterium]